MFDSQATITDCTLRRFPLSQKKGVSQVTVTNKYSG